MHFYSSLDDVIVTFQIWGACGSRVVVESTGFAERYMPIIIV